MCYNEIYIRRSAGVEYVLVTVRRLVRCAFHIPHSKAHGRRPTTRQHRRGTAFFSYQTTSSSSSTPPIGRSDARAPQRPQNTLCPRRNISPPSHHYHNPPSHTNHYQSPAHPRAVHGVTVNRLRGDTYKKDTRLHCAYILHS